MFGRNLSDKSLKNASRLHGGLAVVLLNSLNGIKWWLYFRFAEFLI